MRDPTTTAAASAQQASQCVDAAAVLGRVVRGSVPP